MSSETEPLDSGAHSAAEAASSALPPFSSAVPDAERVAEIAARVRAELSRVIVGQERVVELLLVAVLSRGHGLFQGVPGLAKTLLIHSLAETTACSFSRVQFTPDLLPSDITGTEVLEEDRSTGRRVSRFIPGPIFANLVLADEVNRTPPRTQAALLQAMQEFQVTIAGETFSLDKPFFVLGTQNPIEQEGTYPLPEAQLDRFMFKIHVEYPSFEEELAIAESTTSTGLPTLAPLLTRDEILALQQVVRKVLVGRSVSSYAVSLVRATRPRSVDVPDFVKKYLTWGAGPRACQALLLGAKANALLDGRVHVSTEDIRYVSKPVMRHRLVTSFAAESDGVTTDHIVEKLFEVVREPLDR